MQFTKDLSSYQSRFLIFIFLALLQCTIQISALSKGTEYIVNTLTVDDAYYYLQTAWNFKELGFPTFDGIHPTNGVQLLWFWLVSLLALVSPTKISLLFITLIVSFCFNSLCYLAIWQLSETLEQPVLGLYMASLWLLLTFGSEFYSTGMENSLHALVFWVIIWQVAVFLTETEESRKYTRFLFLTILFILNVWSRLDAAIFSVILYILCLLHLDRSRRYTYIFVSVGIAITGGAVQLLSFYQMGGTLIPISSLVKSVGANWSNILNTSGPRLVLALILLAAIEWLLNRYLPRRPELRTIWYSLLLGVLVHVLVTSGVDAYSKFLWYLSPFFVFLTITFAYLANGISQLVSQTSRVGGKVVPIVTCLPLVLLSMIFFYTRLNMVIPSTALDYQAAVWISKNLPAEAKLASWNAGILGYFSDRPVINLDGLINGIEYYDKVITGPDSWSEYIRAQNVDYIVDFKGYVTSPEYSVVETFSLPHQTREVMIWQVGPKK